MLAVIRRHCHTEPGFERKCHTQLAQTLLYQNLMHERIKNVVTSKGQGTVHCSPRTVQPVFEGGEEKGLKLGCSLLCTTMFPSLS